MGNAQSTQDGHKISKPKTNGTSNCRSSKSLSPASLPEELRLSSTSLSPSRDSPGATASPTDDVLVRDDTRYQSLSHQIPVADSLSPVQKHSAMDSLAATVARSLSRRGSRGTYTMSAKSSMAQLQEGPTSSVATEKTVDLQSAIAILQELRKTASPEDMAALHKALMPVASRDSLATIIDEAAEDIDPQNATMIRRRSLAQPGLATRFGLSKADRAVLRKPLPAPVAQPKQPWTKDMMGASPLARLSSLDLMEPPTQQLDEWRAQTPSEEGYSQLGSMEHGTLQVVNGCPSPVPSMASPGRTERKVSDNQDEDFFTASERGDDSRPTSKHTSILPQASFGPLEGPVRGGGQILDSSPHKRETSPLKQEVRIESLSAAYELDAESVYSRRQTPAPLGEALQTQSKRRFSFEELDGGPVQSMPTQQSPHPNMSAVSLASGYIADLPPSPYAKATDRPIPSPISPLADDSDASGPSDVREQEVILHKTSRAQDFAPVSPRRPLSSHPAPDRPPTEIPSLSAQQPKRPVGVKADSGYSSQNSARNSMNEDRSPIKMHQHNLSTVDSIADVEAPRRSKVERYYGITNPVDISVRIGPITPHKAARCGSPTTEAGAEPEGILQSIEQDPEQNTRKNMTRSKSWRKSVRRSLPRLMSAESTTSIFSKSTSAVSDSTTTLGSERKPNKLQKRRPLSQPPINMSDRHVVESIVPRVPSSVFSRYSTRLSASPGMTHLEQTYDESAELHEGAYELESAPSRSTLPSCFFPDAEDEPAPKPPAHRRLSLGRKSLRRSKTQVDESEVFANGIADFGTAAQSLGTSPYDAAMPAMRNCTPPGGATHPHHLSSKAPRTGPREGWDDETATRIAQIRSRERASQIYAWEQQRAMEMAERRPVMSRPRSYHVDMPSRPVSYHEDQVPQSSRAPRSGSVPRPSLMHTRDQPTLPDVPLLHQHPTPRSAERSQSRPRTSHFNTVQQSISSHACDQPPLTTSPLEIWSPRSRVDGPQAQSRDHSPVKNLVSAFELRSTEAGAPLLPTASQSNWADSSRIWRERRMNAAQSSSNTSSTVSSTTASAVTTLPSQQRKTGPTRTQTTYGPITTVTTTTTIGTRAAGGGQRNSMQTLQNRKSMPQMRDGSSAPRPQSTTTISMSTVHAAASKRQSYASTAGRANGGVTTTTTTSFRGRGMYGMDFGDVPVRVV